MTQKNIKPVMTKSQLPRDQDLSSFITPGSVTHLRDFRFCYLLTIWEDVNFSSRLPSQEWIRECIWQQELTKSGKLHLQMALQANRIMNREELKFFFGQCHVVEVPSNDWDKIVGYCKKCSSRVKGTKTMDYKKTDRGPVLDVQDGFDDVNAEEVNGKLAAKYAWQKEKDAIHPCAHMEGWKGQEARGKLAKKNWQRPYNRNT